MAGISSFVALYRLGELLDRELEDWAIVEGRLYSGAFGGDKRAGKKGGRIA
jgi:hypothetical protein